jgi:hypothetical protein
MVTVHFSKMGGCGNLQWYAEVQSIVLDPSPAISIASSDNDGNCQVNLLDFVGFASSYLTADACNDYNCDGQVGLGDFISFASHYQHDCSSP